MKPQLNPAPDFVKPTLNGVRCGDYAGKGQRDTHYPASEGRKGNIMPFTPCSTQDGTQPDSAPMFTAGEDTAKARWFWHRAPIVWAEMRGQRATSVFR